MESPSEDKEWAAKYLLDPLNAPGPNEETSPGTHFISSIPARASSVTKRTETVATTSKTPPSTTYPTPPNSASPSRSSFHPSNPYSPTHRQAAFGSYADSGSNRKSLDGHTGNGKGRERVNSLGERFPGDMSHRPLDQLRREAKAADRSPHLKKKHIPGADLIDSLDRTVIGGAYHHEGPYDATLLARNTSHAISPVDAVRESNAEALRATPKENIRDALDRHVPLQGTSIIPPGMAGLDGIPMDYEEGSDLMREPDAPGGAYKRWADVKYLPGDYKGKGEPSYSIEKALKDHKHSDSRGLGSDSNPAYEMQPPKHRLGFSRQRSASGSRADENSKSSRTALKSPEFDGDIRRSNSTGRRVGEGLKKRFGSLRKSKRTTEG